MKKKENKGKSYNSIKSYIWMRDMNSFKTDSEKITAMEI